MKDDRNLQSVLQDQHEQGYSEIFRRIDSLLELPEVVLVAIDGNCGAGKSTLASLINNVYDSNIFHMDDFFLQPYQKTDERLEEVGGNVDYVRFHQEVISGIQSKCKFSYQIYDCKDRSLSKTVLVTPKKLNIIEGAYSMHPTLIDNYKLKIFLQIDPQEQRLRILRRNGISLQQRFLNEWIPLENQYFDEMKIREQSDLVY